MSTRLVSLLVGAGSAGVVLALAGVQSPIRTVLVLTVASGKPANDSMTNGSHGESESFQPVL